VGSHDENITFADLADTVARIVEEIADVPLAAGTLLYLIFALIPWYSVDGFDLGSGFSIPGVSVNGFDSGMIVFAFVLLLLATAWLLPWYLLWPLPLAALSRDRLLQLLLLGLTAYQLGARIPL